ncbi:methyl-accepting chemotaxis protein [Propionispora hippei]|uniref:Methyl-accepting chemotaxis protein n=1 Tax=Propionispora hippei DSM 15287 TaxID=1123003 RepID=A0A1M6I0L8_9FIRM|nr:HAMP domain-containing methyl-accepting chemotaxis protein [Propionispora hippei]SHJ27955.1 Methyl-accepting chemotaxis protein [Propionispora hippei DSM 15287]
MGQTRLNGVQPFMDRLGNCSLKTKFIAGLITVSAIISAISLFTFYLLFSSMDKLNTMIQITIESNEIYNKAKATEDSATQFLTLKKQEDREAITAQMDEIARHLTYLEATVNDQESQSKLGSVKALTANYNERLTALISFTEAGQLTQAIAAKEELVKATNFLKTGTDELIATELSHDKSMKEKLDREARLTSLISVALLLLVAAASTAGAGRFSNQIANHLSQMARYAQQIAGGNLQTEKIRVKSRDDLALLAEAFNQMSETLRQLIGKINGTSTQVAQSVGTLKTAMQQNSRAIEQIASSIQQVSDGTGRQFQASEQAADIITQLYERNKTIAENAGSVTAATGQAAEAANAGKEKMNSLQSQMDVIQQKIVDAKEITDHLQARSQDIRQVLDSITSLASQTNLLSLNASIEAARAGEYGRGFTVVADEIRKLSSNTAEAAKDITKMLQDIQTRSHSVATSMTTGVEEVKEGLHLAEEAILSFHNIVTTSENADTQVKNINREIEDIAKDIAQVEETSQNILQIAKSSADGSSEVAAAIEEQSASMEEILSSLSIVSDMTEELKQCILRFKL